MPSKDHRKYSVEEVAASLEKAKGLVTLAAADLKAHYHTVKRMVDESPTLQRIQREARAQMGDFTEGKLFEAIGRGDAWAVQFYLRTQCRERGYNESVDLRLFLREKALELAEERGLNKDDALREADAVLAEARRG